MEGGESVTGRVQGFLQVLRSGAYTARRRTHDFAEAQAFAQKADMDGSVQRLRAALAAESCNVLPYDIFGFNRTVENAVPFSDPRRRYAPNNIAPDYGGAMEAGFDGLLTRLDALPGTPFRRAARQSLETVLDFCDRYRQEAQAQGHTRLARALENVPRHAPDSFYEACLFVKILIYTLRLHRIDHVTLGRFDQYTYPYYIKDVERGAPREELLETIELFFLSLNIDTDLYFSEQRGDNGQSLVLGGYGPDGQDMFNPLSELCLTASMELCVIDPKINLRVSSKTPLTRLTFATRLTRKGLGFPQYCNDDVIVPGLIRLGYRPEDAYNYCVAACWEPIIPGCGMDIVNRRFAPLTDALTRALHTHLCQCDTFEQFLTRYLAELRADVQGWMAFDGRWPAQFTPAPYLSVFMGDCIDTGRDVSEQGARYCNLGYLPCGLSTVADSLLAVKRAVYEDKVCTPRELLAALDVDFAGHEELQRTLLDYPKMGSGEEEPDSLGWTVLHTYSATLNGKKTASGAVFRAGTGSAQGYVVEGARCPATPDGRHAGTPFASSFSPSLQARSAGPLSCIRSFTRGDLTGLINGGPLTMELHQTVFRNEDGVTKTAMLVKAFIDRGGHQLQLNAVDRRRLLEARACPAQHKDLIVRVWGWSGYFTELDEAFQEHIIKRTEFEF